MDREKSEKMKRVELIFWCLLMPLMTFPEQVFEVGVFTGMAGFSARCTYVKSALNMHNALIFSYSYHSPYAIGVRIGATIDRHKAGFGKHSYTDTYIVIDKESDRMQVDYSIGRLREYYTTWSVGIPLQIAFSWSHFNLYLGPKAVFPFSTQRVQRADNAALSVYYEKQDNRVYESFPLAASRAFDEKKEGTQPAQKIQWWFAAELCYDIKLHTSRRYQNYLSVGVYADVSFTKENDAASDKISLIMLSDTRDGFPLHRILTPVVSANRQEKRLVSNRIPYDFGIKIAFRFAPHSFLSKNPKNCLCYNVVGNNCLLCSF